MTDAVKIRQLRNLHALQSARLDSLTQDRLAATQIKEEAVVALAQTQDEISVISSRIGETLQGRVLDTGAYTTLLGLYDALCAKAELQVGAHEAAEQRLKTVEREFRECDAKLDNLQAELRRRAGSLQRRKQRDRELALLDRTNFHPTVR